MRIEQFGDATLYLGDCLEVMADMEVGSVDAVVTDPPYFLPVQTYVEARGAAKPQRMLGEVLVLTTYFQLAFGTIDRLVHAAGNYYVFCDAKSYPSFWRALFPLCKYVRLLIWDKKISFNGYTWRHQHELIAWGEGFESKRIPTGDGDVISERAVLQANRNHPAEKPVEVLERLVGKHPSAQTIFDPYMGSGTTGVACMNLGRKFIGIEIEEKYFDIACRRIDLAARQERMAI